MPDTLNRTESLRASDFHSTRRLPHPQSIEGQRRAAQRQVTEKLKSIVDQGSTAMNHKATARPHHNLEGVVLTHDRLNGDQQRLLDRLQLISDELNQGAMSEAKLNEEEKAPSGLLPRLNSGLQRRAQAQRRMNVLLDQIYNALGLDLPEDEMDAVADSEADDQH